MLRRCSQRTIWRRGFIGALADADVKRLVTLVLGDEQERALRPAAAAALERTAEDLRPEGGRADDLAAVIGPVFRSSALTAPPGTCATFLEALHVGVAAQLAVLDRPDVTGTGQSQAELIGVPAGEIARRLAASRSGCRPALRPARVQLRTCHLRLRTARCPGRCWRT